MSDESYGLRTHIRVCAECSSNLLIEERTQFQRSQIKGRDENDEPIFKQVWRNNGSRYWCPSCSRNVDTKWSDETPIRHAVDEDLPDGVFRMDNGFSWYHGRLCSIGAFEFSGSDAMCEYNQIRSGFIEGFLAAIDNLLAKNAEYERREDERWKAMIESSKKQLDRLDEMGE